MASPSRGEYFVYRINLGADFMDTYFYVYPFADVGGKTPIPTDTQVSGEVSYEQGWTSKYELDLTTNPDALPIPRQKSNDLMFNVTDNIRQYQTQGTPQWITAADNNPGGVPTAFAYDLYALVRHDAGLGDGLQIYENQVPGNTDEPGTTDTWNQISGSRRGVPVGTIIDFAGINIPAGYLACNSQTVERTTYADLFNAITRVESVTLTTGVNTFTLGVTFGLYVGMAIEGTGIPGGTEITDVSGTTVTMSNNATVSGAEDVRFFSWGNGNGTTTFNVPNLSGRVSMQTYGAESAQIGNQIGQIGGAASVTLTEAQLATHGHLGSVLQRTPQNYMLQFGGDEVPVINPNDLVGAVGLTIATAGDNEAHPNIQPSAIVHKLIKF